MCTLRISSCHLQNVSRLEAAIQFGWCSNVGSASYVNSNWKPLKDSSLRARLSSVHADSDLVVARDLLGDNVIPFSISGGMKSGLTGRWRRCHHQLRYHAAQCMFSWQRVPNKYINISFRIAPSEAHLEALFPAEGHITLLA